MTISLHLEAANVSELQRMCAELAHSGAPAEAIAATVQTVADPMAAARAAKAAKKSKVTAEAATQPVEEMTQTAVSPPAAEASTGAPTSAPTIDDLRAKLRELSSSEGKGIPAVTAILNTFKIFKDGKYVDKKVERISDLAPGDYAAAIAKVDAALSQS